MLTGLVTALAGVLAYFTVPAHTEQAPWLMYWHLGLQSASLLLFAYPAWVRSRGPGPPGRAAWLAEGVAAALLAAGSGVGGFIANHGGAGVMPELLPPSVHENHSM